MTEKIYVTCHNCSNIMIENFTRKHQRKCPVCQAVNHIDGTSEGKRYKLKWS